MKKVFIVLAILLVTGTVYAKVYQDQVFDKLGIVDNTLSVYRFNDQDNPTVVCYLASRTAPTAQPAISCLDMGTKKVKGFADR